ncbi:ATP-binding protein [Pedobacter helvus]|uniref:ATP-binding protein n=1 Tax=Pedobacter helvus TaxID=2563444 RepID=A0ABW9JCA3_9SPHI|nr:ATP-binding protein [Pedobacter ureilyticus]
MSKINIQGTVDNIRSKSNVYTPLIEAVVNAIDAINESKRIDGEILIKVKRLEQFEFDNILPEITSIEIHDNGVGFRQKNRDSFDTLYSLAKKSTGGKGFGRFMFLKYFSEVKIESNYKEEDGSKWSRKFLFGREDEIIVGEKNEPNDAKNNSTIVYLNHLVKDRSFDKELETIARKLLEKLLIFFINEKFPCPQIRLQEFDGSKELLLNNYLTGDNEIKLIKTLKFPIKGTRNVEKTFTLKIFKIYYSKFDSKIILTAHNREVVETLLHTYVPEFVDEFYDEINRDGKLLKKNFSIKAYVLGEYLDSNVSLERETFNFDKEKSDLMYEISQSEIEKIAAEKTKDVFITDVKQRVEKKRQKVYSYVNDVAPWHKTYIDYVDLTSFSYNSTNEKIELELQKFKFQQEQETKKEILFFLNSSDKSDLSNDINSILSKVTDIGKSDLAHYVCNRKVVLDFFDELRKRNEDGNSNLEKEIHSLIFPMNSDSRQTSYEEHNLWLLDERLVFSEYVASDRKISKKSDALGEPDLLIFDAKRSFRSGDNEYSNPITIFEFKRPKRESYRQEDDPILQIGNYLEKIRQGKYEMPDGAEPIKVNDNTPVYAYVIADLSDKIKQFAKQHSLTSSPDGEGYFGFHIGYKMYIEVISFKKLLKDATLRNKIFFKKLHIE